MTAQACPGPHAEGQRPETEHLICTDCQRALDEALRDLPELAVRVYLASEPGRRPARPDRSDGIRRGDSGHAPLPVDGEADALMRKMFDILGCWHDIVQVAARLSRDPRPRRIRRLRIIKGHLEAADRPNDSTWAVSIAEACRVLRTHAQTLIALPRQPVMRRRQILELAMLTDEALGDVIVTGDGECTQLIDLRGVDAANEILQLKRRIRTFLGDTRGLRELPVPCPDEDCGGALVVWDGTEHVECIGCARCWSPAEYDRLILVLADEIRRSGSWAGTKGEEQQVTQARAAELADVDPATLRSWVARKLIVSSKRDGFGRPTFRLGDVLDTAKRVAEQPRGRRRTRRTPSA